MSTDNMPVLALIDMGLFWAYYRARKPEEALDAPRTRFVGMCRTISARHNRTIVCADSDHLFRRDLAPDYKRRPDKTPEEIGELGLAEAELGTLGLSLVRINGFEADDLIATFAAGARDAWRVRIYSDDKDLEALVGGPVTIYKKDRAKGGMKDWTPDDVKERRGCRPERLPELLALAGDSADGVPGVNGIGEEAAKQVIACYPHALKAWDDLGPDGLPGAPLPERIRKALSKGLAAFTLSYSLTKLNTAAPVDKDLLMTPEPPAPFTDTPAEPVAESNPTLESHRERQVAQEIEVLKEEASPKEAPSILDEVAEKTSQRARAEGWIGTRFEDRLEPRNLREACLLADYLDRAMSPGKGKNAPMQRTYAKIGNREAILAVILKGSELNLPAMLALAHIKPVEGKLEVDAMLMMAVALRSGRVSAFRWIESTDERATIEISVDGRQERRTWDLATAEKAGLYPARGEGAQYSPWMKYTRVMLRWRVVSEILRMTVPEAITGLYVPGEVGEIDEDDVRRGIETDRALS